MLDHQPNQKPQRVSWLSPYLLAVVLSPIVFQTGTTSSCNSGDTSLSELSVTFDGASQMSFAPGQSSYAAWLPLDADSSMIRAIPSDPDSQVWINAYHESERYGAMTAEVGGGEAAVPLQPNLNAVTVYVKAPEGASDSYNVDVHVGCDQCDDGSDCTVDSCDQGLQRCIHTPVTGDPSCEVQGGCGSCAVGTVCNGAGQCVPTQAESTEHAVFWVGHSLIGLEMPYMVGEIAGSLGLIYSWDAQIINGAPLVWNWDNSATSLQADSRVVLPQGGYDVLVLTEAVPLINHTTHSHTNLYAGLFHDLIADQPGAQTYLYETWHCLDTGTPTGCAYDEHDDLAWRPRLDADHSLWQDIVDSVNLSRPAPAMKLSPVGLAMAALYDEIEAGRMPGLTSIADVFSDSIHLNSTGLYFVALAHTAIIYGVDVRGATHAFNDLYGSPYAGLPSQGLATAMQDVIWNTLSPAP